MLRNDLLNEMLSSIEQIVFISSEDYTGRNSCLCLHVERGNSLAAREQTRGSTVISYNSFVIKIILSKMREEKKYIDLIVLDRIEKISYAQDK